MCSRRPLDVARGTASERLASHPEPDCDTSENAARLVTSSDWREAGFNRSRRKVLEAKTAPAAGMLMDKLVSLCKRRGFIFQSSEVYGGLNSCYDYGPMGVELKNNIKNCWWRAMTYHHDNIEGVDASILMHPRVWEASGHVAGFTDPLVDCKACKARFRADHLAVSQCPRKPSKAPGEHSECKLTEPRMFNLMFKTFMGPVEDQAAVVFLRPGDGAGDFRQLPERGEFVAPEAAVRDRADRKSVPQRDDTGQLHLPHPRIRTDGDAVLRAPGRGRGVVREMARRTPRVASRRSAFGPRSCAGTSTSNWRTTRAQLTTSSTNSRSVGRRSKASTTAAIST